MNQVVGTAELHGAAAGPPALEVDRPALASLAGAPQPVISPLKPEEAGPAKGADAEVVAQPATAQAAEAVEAAEAAPAVAPPIEEPPASAAVAAPPAVETPAPLVVAEEEAPVAPPEEQAEGGTTGAP